MIPLLDDFTHVGLACMRLKTMPADRFAVVALNCALGESVDRARVASLLFVLGTLWVLDRLFYRERDWRRLLLWSVHPLILIPFFWASQITTSMTAFWGAVWTAIFVGWFERNKKIWPLLVWSFIGASVRFEAFAYGMVFLAAYFLKDLTSIREFVYAHWRKVSYGVGTSSVAILIAKYALQYIPSNAIQVDFITVAGEGIAAGFYPHLTYPFLQMDSLGRYFEALLLPWKLSYYGDWYQWWEIQQHLWKGFLRLWIFIVPAAVALYLSRKNRESFRRVLLGFGFFAGTTLMLSSLPRNDWYYPVRAYLGALCFFVFVTPFLLKRRLFFGLALGLFSASTLIHIAFHFSSPSDFRAYEAEVAGARHPFLDIEDAQALSAASKPDEALATLHQLYAGIPVASARISTRAGTFWTLGLYHAWLIYDEAGRADKTAEVMKVLRHSTYYPAVHACLQTAGIPVEECLEGERKVNFCASLTHAFPKLPTRRPYRVDTEQLCKFKPVQKG